MDFDTSGKQKCPKNRGILSRRPSDRQVIEVQITGFLIEGATGVAPFGLVLLTGFNGYLARRGFLDFGQG